MDRYEKGKKCLEDIQKAPVDELFKELEDIAPDLSKFVIWLRACTFEWILLTVWQSVKQELNFC